MKNRQFIVLVILIVAQTFFFYYKFQKVYRREEHILSTTTYNSVDLTHIKETTDETLEITAKVANWIY